MYAFSIIAYTFSIAWPNIKDENDRQLKKANSKGY